MENDTLLVVLEACAPIFSVGSVERVLDGAGDGGCNASEAALPETARQALAACGLSAPDPLDHTARRMVEREVLTPAMPLAALPVESLYKPWTSAPGSQFGGARGLYLGDPARHVQALYDALQVEVPERFAAMPDHLSLLVELLSLYVEAGNAETAQQFARDHFDWLDAYDDALAKRAEQAATAPLFDEEARAALLRGIDQVRAYVALLDELVRRMMAHAPQQGRA